MTIDNFAAIFVKKTLIWTQIWAFWGPFYAIMGKSGFGLDAQNMLYWLEDNLFHSK